MGLKQPQNYFQLKFQNAIDPVLKSFTHKCYSSLADFMVDETPPVNTCWEAYRGKKQSELRNLKMIMKK